MSFNTSKIVFSASKTEGNSVFYYFIHPSLVVYFVESLHGVHYDSANGINLKEARNLLDNIGLNEASLLEGGVLP